MVKQKHLTPGGLFQSFSVSFSLPSTKNQLARDGPHGVAPVIISALVLALNKSHKEEPRISVTITS